MKLILLFGICFVFIDGANAQEATNFHLQVYLGSFPAYGVNLPEEDSAVYAENDAKLVYGFKGDWFINEHYSFGIVHGWQTIETRLLRQGNSFETGTIHKLYLGFRGLYHYGIKKWDLYSGIKLGFVYKRPRNVKTEPGQTPYLKSLNNDIVFQPGIVAFGAFYSIKDNISLGSELSIGSPSFLSLGLAYRL